MGQGTSVGSSSRYSEPDERRKWRSRRIRDIVPPVTFFGRPLALVAFSALPPISAMAGTEWRPACEHALILPIGSTLGRRSCDPEVRPGVWGSARPPRSASERQIRGLRFRGRHIDTVGNLLNNLDFDILERVKTGSIIEVLMSSNIFLIASVLLLTVACGTSDERFTYQETESHEGDLFLSGDQVLEIEDVHFVQRGSIELRDNAKLIVRRSLLEMPAEGARVWGLHAYDNSQLIFEESAFKLKNPWVNFVFHDRAQAVYIDSQLGGEWDEVPWHEFSDSTTLELHSTPLGATIGGKAKLSIRDSPSFFPELGIQSSDIEQFRAEAAESELERDQYVKYWEFPNADEQHIDYTIELENTTDRAQAVDAWGFVIGPNADLTISNSDE